MDRDAPQVAESFEVESALPVGRPSGCWWESTTCAPARQVWARRWSRSPTSRFTQRVLAVIGPEALAVTTTCSVDFMRKPAAGRDVVAEARLLTLGRVPAVGDMLMRSVGTQGSVARASLIYPIRPSTDQGIRSST